MQCVSFSLYLVSKPPPPSLVPPTEVTQLQTGFPTDSITVPATSSAVTDIQTYPDSTETTINEEPTKLPAVNFSNTLDQVEEVQTSDSESSDKEAGMIYFTLLFSKICQVRLLARYYLIDC